MPALPPYPDNLLYPGAAFLPTEAPPYTTSIPGDFLFPSPSFYPSSRNRHVTVVYGRTAREAVGPPHPGLHPRPRLLPGAHDDVPSVYQRIHYPGASAFPSRGLYPFDDGPHIPTSFVGMIAVLRSGSRFSVPTAAIAAAGVARILIRPKFNAFGVLASGADRKMRTVVELGTVSHTAELASFSGTAALETLSFPVEVA